MERKGIDAKTKTMLEDLITSGLNWSMGQATNAFNAMGQASMNRQNNKFAMDMAEYQYSKDLEMWNRANEYNTPAMQMQRYEDAGLNKNLIYSQGQPGMAAATMPKYQNVTGKFDFIQNELPAMSMFQDIRMKDAQIDQIEQLTNNNRIEANLKQQDLVIKGIIAKYLDQEKLSSLEKRRLENALLGIRESFGKDIINTDLDAKKIKIKESKAKIAQIAAQVGLTEKQARWLQHQLDVYEGTGININRDPWYMRIFGKLKNDLGEIDLWEDF